MDFELLFERIFTFLFLHRSLDPVYSQRIIFLGTNYPCDKVCAMLFQILVELREGGELMLRFELISCLKKIVDKQANISHQQLLVSIFQDAISLLSKLESIEISDDLANIMVELFQKAEKETLDNSHQKKMIHLLAKIDVSQIPF